LFPIFRENSWKAAVNALKPHQSPYDLIRGSISASQQLLFASHILDFPEATIDEVSSYGTAL
jgi:hypothetical protein